MDTTSNLAAHARRLFRLAVAAIFLTAVGLPGIAAPAHGRPAIQWSEAGHSGTVTALAFSPDGTLMASASGDGTLKLWRYPDATLVRTLALPYDIRKFVTAINDVRFTSDGQEVVAALNLWDSFKARDSGAVHVFRASDGALLRTFGHQPQGIASLDVSPDGRWVATAGQGSDVTVWRLSDGKRVKSLHGHPGPATDVHFSPTGDRLCASYGDHDLTMVKTNDWATQWTTPAHSDDIHHIDFSPSGDRVATASLDGTSKLFDAADGSVKATFPVGAGLQAVTFSPDGNNVATGGFDGAIRLWDVASGALVKQFANSGSAIASLRYADQGHTLISGGEFVSRIKAWNPADGTLSRALSRIASSVDKVAYSPDSNWIAIAPSFDNQVSVFNAASGQRKYTWNTQIAAEAVAFSPDNRLLALPGADHTVVVRRLSDGKTVRTLTGHAEDVVGLAFSHDGKLLASGSFFPGTIRLWNTSDWSLAREIVNGFDLGAFGPFESLSFSPDDALLGSVAEAAPLIVRVADGSVVAHPEGTSRSAVFSPDGQLYAISGGVNLDEVRIFRTSDWSLTKTLPHGANDVAFTPDGTTLLAAHLDALRFWRTSDWTTTQTYDQELGYSATGEGVQSVAIAPDARRFAYGRYDATLIVAKDPGQKH